jgi:hypothetical protein
LIGVFWTPNEFLLFHSLTIFNEFFVNLFQEYACDKIADNGKSIGEVRDFEELKVQETPNVANAFQFCTFSRILPIQC